MWGRSYLTPIAVGIGLCTGVGCSEPLSHTASSKFEVTIDADADVRAVVADVVAQLERRETDDSGWTLRVTQRFNPSKAKGWPLSFDTDFETASTTAAYQLEATARDERGAVVAQVRALTDYESARRRGIRVRFDAACLDLSVLCAAGLTCRAGECVSAQFDPDAWGKTTAADTSGAAGSSTGTDPAAIASENTACDHDGERRCADSSSTTPVVCTGAMWRMQPDCGAMQRCDTSNAATRGTCRGIAAECVGREPFEPFCDNDMMRVCDADLLESIPRPCADGERCAVDAQGNPRCACQPGFVRDNGGCEKPSSCMLENGGCDPLTTCTVNGAQRVCGACPAGWTGNGEVGCLPTLLDLHATNALLEPAFSPDVLEYRLKVGILQQNVALIGTAPSGATIAFNGQAADSGMPWTSPALALGDTVIQVQLFSDFGVSKNYRITIHREGVQQAYLKPDHASPGAIVGRQHRGRCSDR